MIVALIMCSLLLATGLLFGVDFFNNNNCRLFVLGDWKSLALCSKTVQHVTASSADKSIGVVSHVGSNLALGALVLELLDFTGSLDVVVFEEGKGSLLVNVLYLLGLGVNLLLSLSLTTVELNHHVDAALGHETGLIDGHCIVKSCSVEHKSVDAKIDSLLDLGSKIRYKEIKNVLTGLRRVGVMSPRKTAPCHTSG